MRFTFPIIPVLLRIAAALPAIVAEVNAEVKAAKAAASDGGAQVTAAEVAVIVGRVMERLGAAILPTVLKANNLPTE